METEKIKEKNKVSESINLSDFIVDDIIDHLGVSGSYISPNIPLNKVGSIVAYEENNSRKYPKKCKPSVSNRARGGRVNTINPVSFENSTFTSIRSQPIDVSDAFRFNPNFGVNTPREVPQDRLVPTGEGILGQVQQVQFDTITSRTRRPINIINADINRTRRDIEFRRQLLNNVERNIVISTSILQRENLRSNINGHNDEIRRLNDVLSHLQQELLAEREMARAIQFRRDLEEAEQNVWFNSSRPVERFIAPEEIPQENTISDEDIDNFDLDFEEIPIPVTAPVVETKKVVTKSKVDRYKDIIYEYGNVGIIKGYIIQGKVYNSNEDIIEALPKTSSAKVFLKDAKAIILSYYIKDDKIETKLVTTNIGTFSVFKTISVLLLVIPFVFKLRVNSSKNSSELFGKKKEKKSLENTYIDGNWELVKSKSKKLSRESFFVEIYIDDTTKSKFLISDCSIINNKLTGYVSPINKTIHVGTKVEIVHNKDNYKLESGEGSKGIVIDIIGNPSSKRISKTCSNRRKDLMKIKLRNNKILTVYAEDLKFIENKKEEEKYTYSDDYNKKAKSSYSFRVGLDSADF